MIFSSLKKLWKSAKLWLPIFPMSDVSSHLHGLAFFNLTQIQQRQNFFQNLLKLHKTENAHFIKIICLLKLINFLFTHLKLIFMNFNYKIINIL